jgi:hypothetical protein
MEPKPLYPPEYRAIDWQAPEMNMIEEARAEIAIHTKYAQMVEDADFPPGSIVNTHA